MSHTSSVGIEKTGILGFRGKIEPKNPVNFLIPNFLRAYIHKPNSRSIKMAIALCTRYASCQKGLINPALLLCWPSTATPPLYSVTDSSRPKAFFYTGMYILSLHISTVLI